jgi:hypothetical protein
MVRRRAIMNRVVAFALLASLALAGCSGVNDSAMALGDGPPSGLAYAEEAFKESGTPAFAAMQTRRLTTTDIAGVCEAAAKVLREMRYTEFRASCAAGILAASPINDMDDYAYAADGAAARDWSGGSGGGSSSTTTSSYRPYFDYQSKPPGGFWGNLAYSVNKSMATGYTSTTPTSPSIKRLPRSTSWRAAVIVTPDGPDGVTIRVWFDWLRNVENDWWVYPQRTVWPDEYRQFFTGLEGALPWRGEASVEQAIRAPFEEGMDPPGMRLRQSGMSAAKLATMQERVFDSADRDMLLRQAAVTLLSLGYVIEDVRPGKAALRVSKGSLMRGIVTIEPRSAARFIVRFDAYALDDPALIGRATMDQVDDPAFYQQFFFAPLSKTLGLSASPVT